MSDLSESLPYYDQISHAARPKTQYANASSGTVTGSFAGLVAITDCAFTGLTSSVTGMESCLTAEITVPAGTYLAGDVSSFQLLSGTILAIGD